MPGPVTRIIVVIMIASGSTLFAQGGSQVVFEREVIKIFVDTSSVRVDGTYVLKNTASSPRVQRLFYPFPIDSLHIFPSRIAVRQDGDSIAYRITAKGVVFPVNIPANDSATFRVTYEQDCLDNAACYILTSTVVWKEPLKTAQFEVNVPDNIELTWIAYEVQKVKKEKGGLVHAFGQKDFMPDKDLCIRWRVRAGNK